MERRLNYEFDMHSLEGLNLFYQKNIISLGRSKLLTYLFIYCDYIDRMSRVESHLILKGSIVPKTT